MARNYGLCKGIPGGPAFLHGVKSVDRPATVEKVFTDFEGNAHGTQRAI